MAFRQIQTGDKNLEAIQDNVADALRPLENAPTAKTQLVTTLALTTGQDNLVPHGLGRIPRFWVLAGINVSATVWNPASASLQNQASNVRLINFQCSANCTVSILFG